jgi:hypothetical protein
MELIEIITIGLPFCAFKILSGLLWGQHWLTALGLIDLVINVLNLGFLIITRKRLMDACLLSLIVRKFKRPSPQRKSMWQDFGNSLDVFLSFTIVAIMIGGQFLQLLPANHMNLWNLAVILNVFGAGYGRLRNSLTNLKS